MSALSFRDRQLGTEERLRRAKKMGDSRRIDILRELALSSMPSLTRKPVQRQKSGSIDIVERRKSLASSFPSKREDKEEGELSSEDEVEYSRKPLTAVETSLSFAPRNAGLSIHASSQGNLKEERHTSAATFTESVPHIAVSSAPIFSTSTRVSIVNKSQLLSAFTAQAPPLTSSQTPEPVHNGSGVRIATKKSKQNLEQVTSSGAAVYNANLNLCHGASGVSLSTAALQLTSSLPDPSLSQASQIVSNHEDVTQSSSLCATRESSVPFPAQIPLSTLPNGECSVRRTAVPIATRDVSPVVVSVTTTTIGAPESANAAAVQTSAVSTAVLAGVPIAVATAPAVPVFGATSVIGGVVRKEAGLRKEAEAFLASLRIPLAPPLPISVASGDEKGDAFLIKFDDDSDSDGDSENHSNFTSRYEGRSTQKAATGSSGAMNTSVSSQSSLVMPNQIPSGLKVEIDRMKKQIAAMERTKGKTLAPSVLGKAARVLPADASRHHMVLPATDPKSGTNLATANIRPASVDLETMRLRIAAKESELQQRRQRLAVKGPDNGKGVNDLKGSGGVPTPSLPATFRSTQIADGGIAHAGNPVSKLSSSGLKTEVQTRTESIPALALGGLAGANLADFKNKAERRGLDGCNYHQHVNHDIANFAALQVGPGVSEVLGQPSVTKGIKRSRAEVENREALKVSRFENSSVLDKDATGGVPKEAALPHNVSETSKGGNLFGPSIYSLNQSKRKMDAMQTLPGAAVSGISMDFNSPAGFEAAKKLKMNSRSMLIDSGCDVKEESLVNGKHHAHPTGQHGVETLPPTSNVVQVSAILAKERRNSSSPNGDTSTPCTPSSWGSLKSRTQSTSDMVGGTPGSCDGKQAASLSAALPVTGNRSGSMQKITGDVLIPSNVIRSTGVNGDKEGLRLQQAGNGPEIFHVSPPTFGDSVCTASFPQPVVKARHDDQIAHCTVAAITEPHPKTLGTSNVNSALSNENNKVNTTLSGRPVSPIILHAPRNLENQVGHSFQLGHSRVDNQRLDAELDRFQHLLEEEELLDKQLQDVQQIRQRCEHRERVARREYREAQCALRVTNADCLSLTQKKEILLSRIHSAEARHYSVRSYLDPHLLPFGGTLVTHDRSKDEHAPSLVSVPNPLPGSEAAEGSWAVDVNGPADVSRQVHESLNPLSSSHVQRLLEEEELLDKQLQDVQQIGQRCEHRERVARREYREAQCALRTANADCLSLTQKKEFLLSRLHAAEARHYSVRSYLDPLLLPFGGTLVTHDQSKDEHQRSLVSVPNPLPVSQAADGSWEVDVNVEQDLAGQVHKSLSPLSSNSVDVAAVVHRDAQSGVSIDVGEDYPSCKQVKGFSSDDKEQESLVQMVVGDDCSGQIEDQSVVGEENVQHSLVDAERQEDLGAEIVMDKASQAGTQCINDLFTNGPKNSPVAELQNAKLEVSNIATEGQIADLENASLEVSNFAREDQNADLSEASLEVSNFAKKCQNATVRSKFTPDMGDMELPDSALLEDIEAVPQTGMSPIAIDGSMNCTYPSANRISVGAPRLGVAVSAVSAEIVRLPVLGQNEGSFVLNVNQVMDMDLEHQGSDQEYHGVEQITVITTSQDSQSTESLHTAPDNPPLVHVLNSTDTHESVNTEEGKVSLDGTRWTHFSENAPTMNDRDDANPIYIKDSTITDGDRYLATETTVITTSQDSRSVDSINSAPKNRSFVEDLDGTNAHKSVNTEEGKVSLDDSLQNDLSENTPTRIHRHDAVSTYFKDSSTADRECCPASEIQDLSVSMFMQSASQVLPEKPSSLQEVELLDSDTTAMEVSKNGTGHAKEIAFEPEGETTSIDVLCNSDARDEAEIFHLEQLAEGLNDGFVSVIESQHCSSLRPPFSIDVLREIPRKGDGVSLPDMDRVNLVTLAVSSITRIPEQTEDLNKPSKQELHPLYPAGASDVIDAEMQNKIFVGSPTETPGEHVVCDVECLTGSSPSNTSAPEPGSHMLTVQEDFGGGLLRERSQGFPGAECKDFASGTCLRNQSPKSPSQVCHDQTPIWVHQCSLPSSKVGNPAGDNSVVIVQVTDAENGITDPRPQGGVDCVEDQQHSTSEVWQQSALKMSFDGNCTVKQVSKDSDSVNRITGQDGFEDLCRTGNSEMMSDNSETSSQSELEIQETGLATAAVDAEDEQVDQLNVDCPESLELTSEDTETKEMKGVDIEVFRKALLDGNVFERRTSGGDAVDAANSEKLNRDEVSDQILPQLQHHRLEHLLDMVEVRGPELSLGGDSLVQEDSQYSKYMASPAAVLARQQDSPMWEGCGTAAWSTDQVQLYSEVEAIATRPSSTPLENTGDPSGHWVPSAVSLAVFSCIPGVVGPLSEPTSFCDAETILVESGLPTSFDGFDIPVRYESPLTIFRSYRICPQFSGPLHLSCRSSSWSHAINPFKPLCKFEHRGKCNNDDCPWQHVDNYSLSSSQLESQILNYVDQSRCNLDCCDVAVTCYDKDADSSIAAMSSPMLYSSVTAIITKAQFASHALLPEISRENSLPLNWTDREGTVPIYRTGSYTWNAEDSNQSLLLSYSLQLDRKVDCFHSFLLSPSIHRPLPSDMPCLLNILEHLSLFTEAPAYRSPRWRYMGDIEEKLMSTKDCSALQELMDEEMWLELALRHIDYDISTENYKARDQALFYLSRALESKPCSVPLWVVYSCLFHTRKENPEQDDMFRHAVQYNQGSYELWVLYINSRSDFQSRLEAYEKGIVALVDEGTQLQLDKEELSAYILDLGLQMLYCWCVSQCSQDFVWVDDLICEASTQDNLRQHKRSTAALLSHLTQHDACVLWIACTYFLACAQLPTSVITRLGFKQELPDGLNWDKHAKVDEMSHRRVIKALSTAASQGLGCLSLDSAHAVADKDNFPRQVLGVNYVQCLALYEGLDSAACMGQKLIKLYPSSLELILIGARIDERRKGPSTGLHVFEEAVLQWPSKVSGIQRLWNQFAGHALLWGGKDLAKSVLLKCTATTNLHLTGEVPAQVPVSMKSLDAAEGTDCQGNSEETWSRLREYFLSLTSKGKRLYCGANGNYQLSKLEDSVFSLINLALVEALRGDIAASQSAINKAMKAAISQKDLTHGWRELAAFQLVCFTKFESEEGSDTLGQSILSLLDRCKTDSHIVSQLTPLSQKTFHNFRKPHIRKFFEELAGPPPLDHSILNSILNTFYGPQLLPSDAHALKKTFHFAECILEAIPGNVPLALSLCKIVGQNSTTLKRMHRSAVVWATALLTSALYQSCPLAPEFCWVEAGLLLRQLGEEKSLEEFYGHALVKYPFSAALQRGLQEVKDLLQIPDAFVQGTKRNNLNLVEVEPMEVGS